MDELETYQKQALRDLQEIGLLNVLHGWLPKLLNDWQENSFMQGKSFITGNKFMTDFISSLLHAKQNIWKLRCEIVHDRARGSLYLEEEREIKTLIKKEIDKGTLGMSEDDLYLMDITEKDLLQKPVDSVRGWLIDVYMARGEIVKAQYEREKVRCGPNYKRKERSTEDVQVGYTKRRRLVTDAQWKKKRKRKID